MFRLKNLLVFLLVFGLFMQTALTNPQSPTSTDVVNIDHLDSHEDSPGEEPDTQPTADHDVPSVSDEAVPDDAVLDGDDHSEGLIQGGGKNQAPRPGTSRDESAEDDGQSDVGGFDAVDGLNTTDHSELADNSNTTDDSEIPVGLDTADESTTTDDLDTPADLNTTDDSITTSGLNLTENPNNQTLAILPRFPPPQCRGICNLKHKCHCENGPITRCRCPRIGIPCSCTRYLDSPAARLENFPTDEGSNTTSTLNSTSTPNTTSTLNTRSASHTDEDLDTNEQQETNEESDTNEQLDTNEEVETTPVSHLAQAVSP
ncbi:hypothetical protein BO86DRAFT_374970 [Aspergillus japonicus CBS 114.51]|uniref:Uncharacterized protein n=1 Tax=Aspergillus japonicus CBS 114.51 TaxID=1448312 RepID=A0A8T8XGH1_ASPJA|nr:hypothetical protein BO86DRAFT_374970 [Aspergillus japonicus CBS 114.51]RAH87028.1 hypothetical protein BO86DRAFT_374970 [Aspergillus japonicus CBS 114.51]